MHPVQGSAKLKMLARTGGDRLLSQQRSDNTEGHQRLVPCECNENMTPVSFLHSHSHTVVSCGQPGPELCGGAGGGGVLGR